MAFKKGISGNPNGSRGEKLFADALRIALKRTEGKDKQTRLMKIAEKLVDQAADGAGWAIGMVMDRIDGKPVQALDIAHDDRTSIQQFSDAELTAIMRGKLAEATAKPKPPAVNKDGNVLN